MKEVEKKFREDVQIALDALHEAADEKIMGDMIIEIDKVLDGNNIANSLLALSFMVGKLLTNGVNLSEYEKNLSLYAFYKAAKSAILTLEDDDKNNRKHD